MHNVWLYAVYAMMYCIFYMACSTYYIFVMLSLQIVMLGCILVQHTTRVEMHSRGYASGATLCTKDDIIFLPGMHNPRRTAFYPCSDDALSNVLFSSKIA